MLNVFHGEIALKIQKFLTLAAGVAAALLLPLSAALPASAADDGRITVCLDPGHGGIDGGSDAGSVKGGKTEADYNLTIALYLRDALNADGRFNVVMTREDDVYLKYLPRALVALENRADLFLSLHCNSIDVDYWNGSEAYVSTIEKFSAADVAGSLLDAISSVTPISRGDVKTREDTGDSLGVYYWDVSLQWDLPGAYWLGKVSDYYSVNTWCSKFGIPSVIVEHAYMTNKNDRAVLDDDESLKKIAEAEAAALIEYYFGHEHTFPAERETIHPANCTLYGESAYVCTVCGAKRDWEITPAVPENHLWRQSASAAATCTEDGFKEFTCQISDNLNSKGYECTVHSYTETIHASGHEFTETDKPSTCTENGYTAKTCAKCGLTEREEIPAMGHDWENGVCTVCGAKENAETAKPETSGDDTTASESTASESTASESSAPDTPDNPDETAESGKDSPESSPIKSDTDSDTDSGKESDKPTEDGKSKTERVVLVAAGAVLIGVIAVSTASVVKAAGKPCKRR